MPRSPRAARRAARPGPPTDTASLRAALAAARLPGTRRRSPNRRAPPPRLARSAPPLRDALRELSAGEAPPAIGRALLARTPEPPGLDCAAGCAFCCILPGDDGGTITAAEARALHAALPRCKARPDGSPLAPGGLPRARPGDPPLPRLRRPPDDLPHLRHPRRRPSLRGHHPAPARPYRTLGGRLHDRPPSTRRLPRAGHTRPRRPRTRPSTPAIARRRAPPPGPRPARARDG